MSWLKKMIFVESEDENGKPPVREQSDRLSVQAEPAKQIHAPQEVRSISDLNDPGQILASSIDIGSITGQVDQEQLKKLFETIEQQSAEGIDYVKFKRSVNSLKDIQPDENIRFTTAFITLKATYPDLTKGTLTQTIDHYVGLMENERKTGLNELSKLRSQNIDKKEQDINKAIKDVERMKMEIQKLTAFITETNEDIVNKKTDYAIRQANFNATIDKIVNQLNGDKMKIETIIKQ